MHKISFSFSCLFLFFAAIRCCIPDLIFLVQLRQLCSLKYSHYFNVGMGDLSERFALEPIELSLQLCLGRLVQRRAAWQYIMNNIFFYLETTGTNVNGFLCQQSHKTNGHNIRLVKPIHQQYAEDRILRGYNRGF